MSLQWTVWAVSGGSAKRWGHSPGSEGKCHTVEGAGMSETPDIWVYDPQPNAEGSNLRHVDFDAAVERMAAVAYEMERISTLASSWPLWDDADESVRVFWRKSMRPLLRAAVGKEG